MTDMLMLVSKTATPETFNECALIPASSRAHQKSLPPDMSNIRVIFAGTGEPLIFPKGNTFTCLDGVDREFDPTQTGVHKALRYQFLQTDGPTSRDKGCMNFWVPACCVAKPDQEPLLPWFEAKDGVLVRLVNNITICAENKNPITLRQGHADTMFPTG